MRKSLIVAAIVLPAALATGSASAADLYRPAPSSAMMEPVATAWNWTGFYAGAHLGGIWSKTHWSDFPGAAFDLDGGSVIGGLQVGYNYQINAFVLGGEVGVSALDLSAKGQCSTTAATECRTRQNWIVDARLKAGYAFDRLLVYGTGGVAFSETRNDQTLGVVQSWGGSSRVGWTAGLGLEYALTNNWSAGIEWKHYDFGAETRTVAGNNPPSIRFRSTSDAVLAKVNYRF